MSGFLTTLLRKERHPELSLRPRVGSRFERPAPARAGEGAEQTGERAEVPPVVKHPIPTSASTPEAPPRPAASAAGPLPGQGPLRAGTPGTSGRGETEKGAGERTPSVSPVDGSPQPAPARQTAGRAPGTASGSTEEGSPAPWPAPGRIVDMTGEVVDRPPAPRSMTKGGPPPRTMETAPGPEPPRTRTIPRGEPESRAPRPTLPGDRAESAAPQRSAPRQARDNPQEGIRRPDRGLPGPPEQEPRSPPAAHDLAVATPAVPTLPHQERHTPGPGAPGRDRARSSPESTSPTIRVSIGRIEVHARVAGHAGPQASAPKASPYQPSLTLDGYLKKRSGGS